MALTIICGLPGSGKSLYQLQYGAKLANSQRATIVTNIPLDFPAFRRFCGLNKYHWLGHCIDRNLIKVLPGIENVTQLFKYKNAIVLIDELGVFFPARSFGSMPKSVLVDLAQTRKGGLTLVGACQYFEQVDKAFRMLATRVVHTAGLTMYDRKLKNEKLVIKNYFHFHPKNYELWLEDKKAQRVGIGGFVRTRFQYTLRCESGRLDKYDIQAFKCFKSFDRLESARAMDNPYYAPAYQEVNQFSEDLLCSSSLSSEGRSSDRAFKTGQLQDSESLFNF